MWRDFLIALGMAARVTEEPVLEEPSPPDERAEIMVTQRWTSPDGIAWPLTLIAQQDGLPFWVQVAPQTPGGSFETFWVAIEGREYRLRARGTGGGPLNRGRWSPVRAFPNRRWLDVNYVPEPSRLAGLVAGALVLRSLSRRRGAHSS